MNHDTISTPATPTKAGPVGRLTEPLNRLWWRLRLGAGSERGAISIEYVIVALALLAVAAAVAAALDVLAADAVEQLPSSVSEVN
jgi:hypothetical protein